MNFSQTRWAVATALMTFASPAFSQSVPLPNVTVTFTESEQEGGTKSDTDSNGLYRPVHRNRRLDEHRQPFEFFQ